MYSCTNTMSTYIHRKLICLDLSPAGGRCVRSAPGGPQTAPEGPKTPPDGPRRPRRAPQDAPDGPKMAQDRPQRAPRVRTAAKNTLVHASIVRVRFGFGSALPGAARIERDFCEPRKAATLA